MPKNFNFGSRGMTPRVHLDQNVAELLGNAAPESPDGPGYRRAAETYFPSNGSLLLAVGLMVAGGSDVHELNPGFPPNGQWIVRSEGILRFPDGRCRAMTLTELRYIVALAQEQHFGRAAERCHVSQPTLSIAVKKLEEELGVLFERGKQKILPTPLGEKIVAMAVARARAGRGHQGRRRRGPRPARRADRARHAADHRAVSAAAVHSAAAGDV